MSLKRGIYKTCKCCSSEFYVPRYRSNSANFCSVKCLNSNQYVRYEISCKRCSKVFKVSNSRRNRKFCSIECSNFAKDTLIERRKKCKRSSIISRGKFTGRTLRKFVFDHKEKKCEICSYDEYEFCLDIHHFDENPLNNSLENLKVLCVICHRKLHKGVLNAIEKGKLAKNDK